MLCLFYWGGHRLNTALRDPTALEELGRRNTGPQSTCLGTTTFRVGDRVVSTAGSRAARVFVIAALAGFTAAAFATKGAIGIGLGTGTGHHGEEEEKSVGNLHGWMLVRSLLDKIEKSKL